LAAGRELPLDTLVDGEIVIADVEGQSTFGALQERLGRERIDAARVALQSPAALLGFDLMRSAGVKLVDQPLCERRARLEASVEPGRAYVQLVAQTASMDEARTG
jgi:ATP-dependent DNA ligase